MMMSANMSLYNGSLEFPLWRPLVSFNLSLFVGVLLPTTLFMNISVFVALLKSKINHKPLLVLYGSLLLGVCVDKILICVDQIVNSPSYMRYCECMNFTLVTLAMPRIFFIVYFIVVVTCQSVLQLLVMKGNQEVQNSYKKSVGCLLLSTVVAVFWTVLFSASSFLSEFPLHCHSFCTDSPDNSAFVSTTDWSLFVVVAFIAFTLLPCVVVTLSVSIWAFYIFKKKFIVRNNPKDASFSRRILLLPVLMVSLLFCTSLLSYLATIVTGEILEKDHLEPFFGNLANFMSDFEYFVLDLLHALSCPLVILYLYTRVKSTWRRMLSCKKSDTINSTPDHFHKSDLSHTGELTPTNSVSL